MSLEVQCPGCSTRYRVGDDKGGKQLRCKHCQEVISVPFTSSGADPFNVFDSVSGDDLYGTGDTTQGGNRGETFDNGDLFNSLDKGPTFSNAPTMPPTARTASGAPRQTGGDNSVLIGVGLGAVVVIGLAIGAFVYLSGQDDDPPVGGGGGGAIAEVGGGGGAIAQGGGNAGGGGEVVEEETPGGGGTIDSGGGETGGMSSDEMTGGGTTGETTIADTDGGTITEDTTVVDTTGGGETVVDTTGGGTTAGGTSGSTPAAIPVVREEHGSLARRDSTLPAGEYYDEYLIDAVAGQRIEITYTAKAFDAYLMLETPSGDVYVNDDAGGIHISVIRLPLPESGTYRIYATSLQEAETGDYDLLIALSDASAIVEQGSLATGDTEGLSGAYQDTFTIQGIQGQRLTAIAWSDAIDTLLQLHAPDGSVIENDDACYGAVDDVYSGTVSTNSLLVASLPANGAYQIVVTSYDPGVTGAYALAYDLTEPADRVEVGNLGVRDDRLSETFEYYDRYTLQGERGQNVRIMLSSPDFNPYVMLISPSGEHFECDTFYPGTITAELIMPLPENGEYMINATTSEARETGDYVLTIDFE